jgi:hypothetical protein
MIGMPVRKTGCSAAASPSRIPVATTGDRSENEPGSRTAPTPEPPERRFIPVSCHVKHPPMFEGFDQGRTVFRCAEADECLF